MTRIGRRTRVAAGHSHAVRRDAPDRTARCSSERRRPSPPKIVDAVRALGLDRFDMKYSNGTLPHAKHDAQHRALRNQGHPARQEDARARRGRSACSGRLGSRLRWLSCSHRTEVGRDGIFARQPPSRAIARDRSFAVQKMTGWIATRRCVPNVVALSCFAPPVAPLSRVGRSGPARFQPGRSELGSGGGPRCPDQQRCDHQARRPPHASALRPALARPGVLASYGRPHC